MQTTTGERPESLHADCPDANRMAAFAEGALEAADADALEEHLGRCPSCRVLAAAVLRETQDDARPPEWDRRASPAARAPAARPTRIPLVAAALLLAALAGATPLLWRTGNDDERPSAPAESDAFLRPLAAEGLTPAQPDDSSPPTEADAHRCIVYSPRGPREAAPAEIRIWAMEVIEGLEIILEAKDGSSRIATWRVPVAYRSLGLPLSAEQRALLVPGRGYRVRVRTETGGHVKGVDGGEFRILSDPERAAGERDWTALRARVGGEPDGDGVLLLRAEWLLVRGRADEALEVARDLAVRHPGRREPSRVALVALERLGLRGEAPWREESKRFETVR